jgi:cell division protein FtsZ
VDTLIVIPNQNLFRIANEKTTFADAFKMADDVLHSGVRGVTDLMVMPGLINLDFADIRSVMTEMGKAMMGTGEAEGESRALAAAEAAISNPLLDDVSMKGARGVLINITGGPDMTLFEVDETANRIRDEVDPEANIIFGSTFGQDLEGRIRVSVVATGIDAEEAAAPRPVTLSLVSDRNQQAAAQRGAAGAAATSAAAKTDGAHAIAEAEPEVAAEPARRPAEAQGPSGLYAYSQAAVQGTAAQAPAAAAPITVAVGAAQAAVAVAEPAPQELAAPAEAPVEPTEPGTDDSFIAPPPVEPEPAPPTASRDQADPFAAAAMENGSRAPRGPEHAAATAAAPKKAPGLFAKMTGGAARALQAATQGGEQRNPAAMAAPGTRPAARATAETRTVAEPSLRAPSKPAAEPRLAGLDSAERGSGGQLDEDLLDIPAFLRRQAN